jgi:hypothetical protein
MAVPFLGELPRHSLEAASFAESLAQEYVRRGGTTHALFVAFAGLVSARDSSVGADCLTALDRKLFGDGDANARNASPTV